MFFADGNFSCSGFKIMHVVYMSQMLLLMAKYFILDRLFLKLPSALSKKLYQYLFAFSLIFVLYKAGLQNMYLAQFAFLSVKIEFSAQQVAHFEVSHPDTFFYIFIYIYTVG